MGQLSCAGLLLNTLTLPVLKANRDGTAQPLREEPFSARNSREKQGNGHRCVATASNMRKLPQKHRSRLQQTATAAVGIFNVENRAINNSHREL